MKEMNGIPIISISDVIKPVLTRYGRNEKDITIRQDIISDIKSAIDSGDLNLMRQFLTGDESFWVGNLQYAYFQPFEERKPLSEYSEWAEIKCKLLLSIAEKTRADDGIIQHIVNYEDFHVEILPFSFGPSFIVSLYELRGLDFFLFHYMGGETIAHDDVALFEHASSIEKSLLKLGRSSEAKELNRELSEKKSKLKNIQREFQGPEYDPSQNIVDKIRIASEHFWSHYLTPDTWNKIEAQSRLELTDEFSTEYLLNQQVLSTWSTPALALCKVFERELTRAIFNPWKQRILSATWSPPEPKSKEEEKRIQSRSLTFKTIQSCASKDGHPPTLGQLYFMAKFWNDHIMNACTDLFSDINEASVAFDPEFSEKIKTCATILENPLQQNGKKITITDARNRSAHPSEDMSVDWNFFIIQFKKILGEPPAEVLKLIVSLINVATVAQQGAALDGNSAALHPRQ